MWTDVYLKAESEAVWMSGVPESWLGEGGEVLWQGEGYAVDVVGQFEGGTHWHVNLRLDEEAEVPESLTGFVVAAPAYPKRRFA